MITKSSIYNHKAIIEEKEGDDDEGVKLRSSV